ncbi:SDR family NAD(P)-dependent oxidoreductase [Erwinia aphidicola]|uniref:SDR family NAD(P)-dependent oxidoreductase n=1 Tax=Erwinia aphidicola TaxID=68334 RepID=UPI003015E17C
MTNKWILITGGSRGIGKALVMHLLTEWNIVFTGRSAESIAPTLAQARSMGTDTWVKGVCCDGTDDGRVAQVAGSLLEQFGAPHAIIHNAGIARDALHIHQNAQDWRTILDNNLVSVMNWHQGLLAEMMTQGSGSIVLMSSVTALQGNSGQTAYAASKAAMIGMARSLAREVGRFGIRVNCLAPGLIASEMIEAVPAAKLKTMRQNIALRRLGDPVDVAQAAAFLIGDNSSYLTGQTLVLDGGLSA